MMKRGIGAVLVLGALLACKKEAPSGGTANAGLVGSYSISAAKNPKGGGTYTGSVAIAPVGEAFKLSWTIPNSPPYSGVGIEIGDLVGVGWGLGASYGVAVYKIEGGKLNGRWTTSGGGAKLGTEVLEGPAPLGGVYQVTSATTPDGKSYKGSVTITATGDTYGVAWAVDTAAYSGVAILEGDTLIAGWGQAGVGAGVVSYRKAGSTLTGRWASPGDTTLGGETLTKR